MAAPPCFPRGRLKFDHQEAEKAMQIAYEQQSTAAVPVQVSIGAPDNALMDVDVVAPERGTKRNAEDEPQNGGKKAKMGRQHR